MVGPEDTYYIIQKTMYAPRNEQDVIDDKPDKLKITITLKRSPSDNF